MPPGWSKDEEESVAARDNAAVMLPVRGTWWWYLRVRGIVLNLNACLCRGMVHITVSCLWEAGSMTLPV